jgi:hypothetical protein
MAVDQCAREAHPQAKAGPSPSGRGPPPFPGRVAQFGRASASAKIAGSNPDRQAVTNPHWRSSAWLSIAGAEGPQFKSGSGHHGSGAAMEYVLVLHDLERPEITQIFGPYASEQDADLALADLAEWPMLRGSWATRPLHRYMVPPLGPSPAAPMPVLPFYPTQPGPSWPLRDGVVWCAAPGVTACAPAAPTFTYTTWASMVPSQRNDEPPDIGVPARV